MSALAVGEAVDLSADLGPTVEELLTMAADVVAMVDGRVEVVNVGQGTVSVHVTSQSDAEHLAWRLGLGDVAEYEPSEESRGFAVWTGGRWPEPRFTVFCAAELVRPLRAFPRTSLRVVDDSNATGNEVA
jgi:hypothetical protein